MMPTYRFQAAEISIACSVHNEHNDHNNDDHYDEDCHNRKNERQVLCACEETDGMHNNMSCDIDTGHWKH